jgi:hypothetical protein
MAIQFADKCGILGQFWITYRDDEDLKGFTEYNDVGLPLAYFIAEGLVKETPLSEQYIDETFELFLDAIDLTEEEAGEVDNLLEIMDIAYEKKNGPEVTE